MEYEYSKKVDNLDKYIKYCIDNEYNLKEKINQTRIIYRKNDNTIARITINKIDNNETKTLDFKEDKLSNEELIVRSESLPITFTKDENILSILDFLGYKKDNTLKRIRYVYEKDNVTFELDEYTYPEHTFVVSLEGNKNITDNIWNEIK